MNEHELREGLADFETRLALIENSLVNPDTISELRYRVTLLEGILKEKPTTPQQIEDILRVAENARAISMSGRKMIQTFLKDRKPYKKRFNKYD